MPTRVASVRTVPGTLNKDVVEACSRRLFSRD